MQDNFGIDWSGPLPHASDSASSVVVDRLPRPLLQQDFVELATVIDPLEPSPDYGINLYIECLEFVKRKMSRY